MEEVISGTQKGEAGWGHLSGTSEESGHLGRSSEGGPGPHQWGRPRNLGTLGTFVFCFSINYFIALHRDLVGSCKKETRVCGLFFGGKRVGRAGEAIHSNASLGMEAATEAPGPFPEPWPGPCVLPPHQRQLLGYTCAFPARLGASC